MDKDHFRNIVKEKRRSLTPDLWAWNSGLIQERLVKMPQFKDAGLVATYLHINHEVGSRSVLDCCWNSGRRVCVPAYDHSLAAYNMSIITPNDRLIKGLMGIDEPAEPLWVDGHEVDLFFVPGLAFDMNGGRVGHGGGHYDHLMRGTTALKIALAFEFQVFDKVPQEPYDIALDMIVTEERVISVDKTVVKGNE